MSMQKKLKMRGILMLVSFFILLAIIFSPVFPGKINGLVYMDNLFNTISKGSVYFIPAAITGSEQYAGKMLSVTFPVASEQQAEGTAKLFQSTGAEVTIADNKMTVKGDMGLIMKSSLEDADNMFQNNGTPLIDKYGYSERRVLYNWWKAFGGISATLTKEKAFKEAKAFDTIRTRSLEPAYNYYGVEAGNYKDYFILIVAALVFYVVYTLWYGFGIMYLFEGVGMKVGH
jgi:hypothetical protein